MYYRYNAGEAKLGTDEKTLVDILAGYDREHIMKLVPAFQAKYNKSLVDSIKDEVSAHFEYGLVSFFLSLYIYIYIYIFVFIYKT